MNQFQAFTFNQESAKQADSGSRIEQTGKYVGVIKSMEFVSSRNTGTQGFEINFESDSKEQANITIWTQKSDGTPLSGTHKVNALLACTGVRGLTPTDQNLEKYDYETRQKINQRCVVAPEMSGKRVGLLLQRENYKNNSGQNRYQMNFIAAFHAQSELMAKELIDRKTTPEALPKALERLMQNPIAERKSSNSQSNNNGYGGGYGAPHGGFGEPPAHFNDAPSYDDSLPY